MYRVHKVDLENNKMKRGERGDLASHPNKGLRDLWEVCITSLHISNPLFLLINWARRRRLKLIVTATWRIRTKMHSSCAAPRGTWPERPHKRQHQPRVWGQRF